jgi:PAS domain S-box-containing protein
MSTIVDRIARFLTATPQRAAWLRFGVPLAIVAVVFAIIPLTPVDGPVGGMIALSIALVCCWFGGPWPAALVPLLIAAISRAAKDTPLLSALTMREMMTMVILTVLTTAVGLAGQYQRRWRRSWQQHQHDRQEAEKALRESEERFRLLADSAPALIWINGPAGAEFVNRTYLDFLGVRNADVRGYDWARFIHPEDRDDYVQAYLRAVEQRARFEAEFRFRRHDGDYRCMRTIAQPRLSTDGTFLGYAGITIDATERKQAEDALKEADRRKDVFLATLAHELRNPLAPLRSGVEVLSLTDITPEQRQMCQIMDRQIKQLARLVDDLISISRINTGKIELRIERVPLSRIINDALEAARPQIDAARHRLQITAAPEALHVDADPVRLVQALANLLVNAAKFTPPEGNIAVDVHRDGNTVVIRVADSGIGISADLLPRIFDPFVQSEDLHVRQHEGLGIGLSIVRSLVEIHGGSVEARSAGLNAGAEFLVRLPLAVPPVETQAAARALEPEPESLKRRVLIADDNQDAARTLAMLLKSVGCEARTVFDGPSALAAAGEFQPDAFVLDLGMPGMSGLEVAKQLRALAPFRESLLIAVTGWGKDEDRRESSAVGFNHHLVKPVDFDQLRRLILSSETGHGAPNVRGTDCGPHPNARFDLLDAV